MRMLNGLGKWMVLLDSTNSIIIMSVRLSGDQRSAIQQYGQLQKEFPTFPHVNFKLGHLHLQMTSFDLAVRAFTLAMEDETLEQVYRWSALIGRRDAWESLGKLDCAKRDEASLQSTEGHRLESQLAIGKLHRQLGMLRAAELCFNQCLILERHHVPALLESASLKIMQRRYELAQKQFAECVQLQASSINALRIRAQLGEADALRRLGQIGQARDRLEPLKAELYPYVFEHQVLTCIERKALKRFYYNSVYELASCALAQGDLLAAVTFFDDLIEHFPHFEVGQAFSFFS